MGREPLTLSLNSGSERSELSDYLSSSPPQGIPGRLCDTPGSLRIQGLPGQQELGDEALAPCSEPLLIQGPHSLLPCFLQLHIHHPHGLLNIYQSSSFLFSLLLHQPPTPASHSILHTSQSNLRKAQTLLNRLSLASNLFQSKTEGSKIQARLQSMSIDFAVCTSYHSLSPCLWSRSTSFKGVEDGKNVTCAACLFV